MSAAPPPLRRRSRRSRLEGWIALLIGLNVLIVAILLATVVYDQISVTPAGHPAQELAAAAPSASTPLMQMGLAHIPTSNACVLCHAAGGAAAVKVIPAIGHPLEGWRQCAACHTNTKLGRTAPGHDGIEQAECLNCHKIAPAGPAIAQPHSSLQGQRCLDCHGSFAHLPTSMASRSEDSCTLCHKPTALPPPEFNHPKNDRLSCRDCHQSVEVGNLPIDHALRADDTCLLCHLIRQDGVASPSPIPLPAPGQG